MELATRLQLIFRDSFSTTISRIPSASVHPFVDVSDYIVGVTQTLNDKDLNPSHHALLRPCWLQLDIYHQNWEGNNRRPLSGSVESQKLSSLTSLCNRDLLQPNFSFCVENKLQAGKDESRKACQLLSTIEREREYWGLGQGGGNANGKRQLNSGYVLKIELKRFVGRMDVRYEIKIVVKSDCFLKWTLWRIPFFGNEMLLSTRRFIFRNRVIPCSYGMGFPL